MNRCLVLEPLGHLAGLMVMDPLLDSAMMCREADGSVLTSTLTEPADVSASTS
jgi:hypothetical protein